MCQSDLNIVTKIDRQVLSIEDDVTLIDQIEKKITNLTLKLPGCTKKTKSYIFEKPTKNGARIRSYIYVKVVQHCLKILIND